MVVDNRETSPKPSELDAETLALIGSSCTKRKGATKNELVGTVQ